MSTDAIGNYKKDSNQNPTKDIYQDRLISLY